VEPVTEELPARGSGALVPIGPPVSDCCAERGHAGGRRDPRFEEVRFAGTGLVATIPGGLFEIFFGIWLIAKGFNPSAITIRAANTAGVVTP
jgi:hypothetical protein